MTVEDNVTSILLGGAGQRQGIQTLGTLFERYLLDIGHDFTIQAGYGGEVRSEYSSVQITTSSHHKPVSMTASEQPDIAMILNQPTMDTYSGRITKDCLLIYNSSELDPAGIGLGVDAGNIAKQGGLALAAGVAMLGALSRISEEYDIRIRFEKERLESAIQDLFSSKGDDTVNKNLDIFRKGYEAAGSGKS